MCGTGLGLARVVMRHHISSHDITLHRITSCLLQLLGSHEVGLRLTDDELHQVVSFLDPEGTGWVPYFDSSTSMREVLLAIYSARSVERRVSEGSGMGKRGIDRGGSRKRVWEWEGEGRERMERCPRSHSVVCWYLT